MCAVTDGDPPFKFTWLKDGKDVVEGGTYSIRNVDDFTSNLAIKQLGPEHNGNYTCRVSNAYGTVQHSDMLLMQCKLLAFFSIRINFLSPFFFFNETVKYKF